MKAPPEGGEGVAEQDPLVPRGGEQQAACEADLEVPCDREAREHAAEGRGLQEHEHEWKAV